MPSIEESDSKTINSRFREWREGWKFVLSAFFVTFVTDGLINSFGLMLVEIIEHFGGGRTSSSAMVSMLVSIQNLSGPITSALAEKYGYRILVVIGALLSSIGFVLSSFASNLYHLWITYGVFGGLGFGLMFVPSNVCMLKHFKVHRTLANGITVSGSGSGTFLFNYCVRLLIDHYGWRGTLLLQGGCVFQCVVFGLLLPGRVETNSQPEAEKATIKSRIVSSFSFVFKTELLKDMRCNMFLLSKIAKALAFFIPKTFIPDQVEQMGMTKSKAVMLTSSIGIANTISRVIIGWIGDRLCFSRFILLEAILLLVGLVTGLTPFMNTFETKLAYTSMFGFLSGGYVVLYPVVMADMLSPNLVANAFGLARLSVGIGVSVAAPIAGLLFDKTGNYDISFIFSGAVCILGGILLLMSKLFREENSFTRRKQSTVIDV